MGLFEVVAICLGIIVFSIVTLTGLVFYLLRVISKLEKELEKVSPPF